MSYLQLSLSNTRARCDSLCLFLSNSGRRKSLSITISLAVNLPASVLIFFLFASSLGTTSFGSADLLIKQPVDPESSRTRNNFLLLMHPIVFAVQIVTGVSFIGSTFGPR